MDLNNKKIAIAIDDNIYLEGQAYFALSRVRSINNLYLTNTISINKVYASQKVKEFYNQTKFATDKQIQSWAKAAGTAVPSNPANAGTTVPCNHVNNNNLGGWKGHSLSTVRKWNHLSDENSMIKKQCVEQMINNNSLISETNMKKKEEEDEILKLLSVQEKDQ